MEHRIEPRLTQPAADLVTDASGDELLTVAEIAAVLKLNQQTIRNWIDQGRLPAVRIGRRVRIKRTDFEQLLTSAAGPSTSTPSAAGLHRRAVLGRRTASTARADLLADSTRLAGEKRADGRAGLRGPDPAQLWRPSAAWGGESGPRTRREPPNPGRARWPPLMCSRRCG